jgi:hypothetical protein
LAASSIKIRDKSNSEGQFAEIRVRGIRKIGEITGSGNGRENEN